jgi:hypothetical protein
MTQKKVLTYTLPTYVHSHVPLADAFEGECYFNANIVEQDCAEQFKWLAVTLAAGEWHYVIYDIMYVMMITFVPLHGVVLHEATQRCAALCYTA